MRQLYKYLSIIIFFIFQAGLFSQDVPDWAWKLPITKVYPTGEYYNLPLAEDNLLYHNPNTTTRVFSEGGQQYLLPPNVRPFPHTATQSEVDAANMKGNTNVMYISWNSYGPSWFGCGFAFTGNGGNSWSGSHQTFLPNNGDPGPWIWPAGSGWQGRLGLSCIGGAGYSTNNGSTWQFAMNFPGAFGFDKNLSAVDDIAGSPYFGMAYTAWTNFFGTNANKIVSSYSVNGGITWDTAVAVSPAPAPGYFNTGCDIEVGPQGIVYAVWANCINSGQYSTEDHLGFAKSTNGGETWISASNNVLDINGIRTFNLFNNIRANGFPRIAIDNTGGPRNGWIYVAIGEKLLSPATDSADMCLARSTDHGSTWTHTRINQDTPGNNKFQYMGDIDVAPDGSIVCSYYDQRNTVRPVTEYWMSRSTDGGDTWVDVAVSDHTFIPAPIQGLAGNYQGDYTGITTCGGKIWPFWADKSSGVYQIWTAGITVIGIQTLGNHIPNSFMLAQNYPNPFNPITKIRFDLPGSISQSGEKNGQRVKLVIYDALGKEAAAIVNEFLLPGSYEVDWNASDFMSGIYFYRLEAGTFIAARKMCLVK